MMLSTRKGKRATRRDRVASVQLHPRRAGTELTGAKGLGILAPNPAVEALEAL